MTKSKVARKLNLKRVRYNTRMRKTVLPYVGHGSDPNEPLVVEDEEPSNDNGELT